VSSAASFDASGAILLADPDDISRSAARAVLSAAAFTVLEADDGPTALARAYDGPLRAVVADVGLPKISGDDVCELLRRDPATANVPMLLTLTMPTSTVLTRASRLAVDVLVKPFPHDVLLERVRDLIARSTALRDQSRRLRDHANETAEHSKRLVHRLRRFETKTPPNAPPAVLCPKCHRPLVYERSFVGGVNANRLEQWDYFTCVQDGTRFNYRHRTRKLREA